MLRDRIMMGATISSLPLGYTKIEYLETDGNHYIDTFYNPNQNTRVVMKVSGFPNTSNAVLFGARTSYTSSDKFAFIASGNSVYRVSFYNKDIELAASISYSGEMVVAQDKGTTYLNGSAVATAPTGTFSCPYTLHLFSFNNGGAPSGYCKVKFYYCQIYDNGVKVRDFIPCTNSDGISGLWDSVNNVFYKMLPAGYTKLDFIETDGTTYIDTGVSAKGGFRAQLTVSQLSATPEAYIIGAHGTGIPYSRNGIGISSDKYMIGMCGYELLAPAQYNTPLEIECSTIIPNAYLKVNGETLGTFSSYINADATNGTELTSNNILIFSSQWHVVNIQPPQGIKAKLWKCKIYSADGTLVRDFIPAMNASGEAGLYDLKNDVWYALLPVVKPKVENKIKVKYVYDYSNWTVDTFVDAQFSVTTRIKVVALLATSIVINGALRPIANNITFNIEANKIRSNIINVPLGEVDPVVTITSISPTEDDTYIYTF